MTNTVDENGVTVMVTPKSNELLTESESADNLGQTKNLVKAKSASDGAKQAWIDTPEGKASFDRWCLDQEKKKRKPAIIHDKQEAGRIADDLLLREAEKLLNASPAAGKGVHSWLFYAGARLQEAGYAFEQAEPIIEQLMSRDPNPASEIEDAWKAALGERASTTPRWSRVNPATIAAVIKDGPTLSELIARSPQPISFEGESRAAKYLDALFPNNPLLCLGVTHVKNGELQYHCGVLPRETWRGAEHMYELCVPNPMRAKWGVNKRAERSKRCLDNTGPRKYVVIEFDSGSLNHHAALHWHLAHYAPLVCCVCSAGKSLHGWYFVEGEPDDKVENFFDYAVSLGCDKATWPRCQLVRLPDGKRDKGSNALAEAGVRGATPNRQHVVYFDPSTLSK
jgi:hypothetical protein